MGLRLFFGVQVFARPGVVVRRGQGLVPFGRALPQGVVQACDGFLRLGVVPQGQQRLQNLLRVAAVLGLRLQPQPGQPLFQRLPRGRFVHLADHVLRSGQIPLVHPFPGPGFPGGRQPVRRVLLVPRLLHQPGGGFPFLPLHGGQPGAVGAPLPQRGGVLVFVRHGA